MKLRPLGKRRIGAQPVEIVGVLIAAGDSEDDLGDRQPVIHPGSDARMVRPRDLTRGPGRLGVDWCRDFLAADRCAGADQLPFAVDTVRDDRGEQRTDRVRERDDAAGGPAARLQREAQLNAGNISSVTRLNWRSWSYPATLSRIVVAPASTYLCRL